MGRGLCASDMLKDRNLNFSGNLPPPPTLYPSFYLFLFSLSFVLSFSFLSSLRKENICFYGIFKNKTTEFCICSAQLLYNILCCVTCVQYLHGLERAHEIYAK